MKKIKNSNYISKFTIIITAIILIFVLTYVFDKKSFSGLESLINKSQDLNKYTIVNENIMNNEEFEEEAIEKFKAESADGIGILTSGVSENLITSAFWKKQPYADNLIIMNENQISDFNNEIIKKVPIVYNLENYKLSLSKDELKNYINYYKIPTKQMYYSDGRVISQDFYNNIIDNVNLEAIQNNNSVSYGLCLKKASIRDFPTDTGVYSSPNSPLDRIQETGCEPCEPVIILHVSKDKQWYFIQMYNYRGWIKTDAIAASTDKNRVFDYVNNKDFLMVTGKNIEVNLDSSDSNSDREFALGTKLFLVKTDKDSAADDYKIKIPEKNSNGELSFTYGKVSHSKDVCLGYLPYTRYNVVTEAFKFLGTEYDWGDKNSGRDCSSFIMYIYKTFGFNLPRNTDEQEVCSDNVLKFTVSDDLQKRIKTLDGLKPGDVLYMPSHAMMYLGEYNGDHYVIHDFLGHNGDGSAINQVAVTSVNFQISQGTSLLEQVTSAVKFQFR